MEKGKFNYGKVQELMIDEVFKINDILKNAVFEFFEGEEKYKIDELEAGWELYKSKAKEFNEFLESLNND